MSKAFVKDENAADVDFDFEPLELDLEKYYVTPQGFADLQNELLKWRQTENQTKDPHFAKAAKKRVHFLEKSLQKTEVIDPSLQRGDQVRFGATVSVQDEEGHLRTYRIVGISEVDAELGKVSYISPIGKALLGARAGDLVSLKTPQTEEELEVIKVEFAPIH